MYECPNCTANLKFSIEKQQLYCESCKTEMDPYAFKKKKDAVEGKYFKIDVFTCPQCGAGILADDDTVATFCSYCGGSTILDKHISKGRRPQHIIPFKKNKEDCKKAYKRMMRYAYFVPKEYKDESYIEKFRSIYMPFWVYSFKHDGKITLTYPSGHRAARSLYAEYDGFLYDASSTFSDDLANAIYPYKLEDCQPFTPSFLSGFYADANDIEKDLYIDDAERIVMEDTMNRIRKDSKHFRSYSDGWMLRAKEESIEYHVAKKDLVMLPVWFLAYRKKDRVAYAAVNGQTGKIAADLPIAIHKYLLSSFLWAIPIFLLLYFFWEMTPQMFLFVSAILSFICAVISNVQLSNIIIRENKQKDRGFISKHKNKKLLEDKRGHVTIPIKLIGTLLLLFLPLSFFVIPMPFFYLIEKATWMNEIFEYILILVAILLVVPGIFFLMWLCDRFVIHRRIYWKIKPEHFMYGRKKLPYLARPFLGILLAGIIFYLKPVSEFAYYMGGFACMIFSGVTFVKIIKYHNILTTHKFPELGKRGGDEDA